MHAQASVTDPSALDALVRERRPEVVFNCAAYNEVDRAEEERDAAFAINSDGPFNVAVACARHGARLVHFSTNFVFDGTLDRPYVEADEARPLSVYAQSKFAGEGRALATSPGALVIRTAAVFGGARGFPARILARARSGAELRVVSDQRVNPTFARDLAGAAVELAEQGLGGIVHAVSEGCCGWDELARATLEELDLHVPVESVVGRDYVAAAGRPANGCLATTRFRPLRPWREALREWAAEEK
jgi:dTDP-4-dehydrorhamnose reductase